VTLTGDDLSIEDVVRFARRGARVEVSPAALERVRWARDVVDRVLERGDLVYGANRDREPQQVVRLVAAEAVEDDDRRHGPFRAGGTHGR
jgi:histidine ammonia-lyase